MSTKTAPSSERRNLSHLQMLMWTGQHLDPDSPIYNMAFRIEIPTKINIETFKLAFARLVSGSETLRTTIEMVQGVPHLRINKTVNYDFTVIDLTQSKDPAGQARIWCNQRCRELFDLSRCLFDTALLKLSEKSYYWYINHHHLISDAWSVTQLLRLQSKVYSACEKGQADAAIAIEEELSDSTPKDRSSHITVPEAVSLEFYGHRASRIGSTSQRVPILIEKHPLHDKLNRLSTSENARSFSTELSQFNVSLTLLFAFLHRVSGQSELSVGAPFHNRLTTKSRTALGLFIELHPIRIDIDNNESFRTLHEKVKTATNDYLRRATSGEPLSGSNASYNVVYNFIHAKFGEFQSVPVNAVWLHPGCSDRQHHLRFHVESYSNGKNTALTFDFNGDVFSESQQTLAVGHFQSLIKAMADNWDTLVGETNLLSARETQKLGPKQTTHRGYVNIIEQFDKNVRQLSDHTAMICGDARLTYLELGERVNHLSHLLIQEQHERDRYVAICLKRSAEAVTAIMATLKSGNAFVPIDPDWPQSRIDFVLKDSHAQCVVTHSTLAVVFHDAIRRINIDTQPTPIGSEFSRPASNTETAYILYTSGSTGTPKGVEISRQSLAHYVGWAAEYYGQGSTLSFPLFTPLTFDLTLTSIFVPLLTGGQIVIYPNTSNTADSSLLSVIEDDLVDIIKLTPSHLSLLEGRKLKSSKVRQLILGGENLKLNLARKVINDFPGDLVIHNEYGPTEATVGCIIFSFTSTTHVAGPSVPIGKPIRDMQAFVMNEHLQLQPAGVAGELFVAGNGLAKGYFGQPELTTLRFIDNPLLPGTEMYRTGDMARWTQEGELEILGRIDQQIKLRGARIELGAIESALVDYPSIDQSIVTAFSPQITDTELTFCSRCGLASNYPDMKFDEKRVCHHCHDFESYRDKAFAYFQPLDQLTHILSSKKTYSQYDCIALLSGGKDSTYMLARLVSMDLKILAFTLDNGYISDEAKANIRRVTSTLNVDHHFESTPEMNKIFVDSLKRYSNVCQGCFKTIYTLSVNLACEMAIPFIVTGLSRGQFFETRLTEDLFGEPCDDLIQIDQTVLDARKAYHRVDDAVSQLLDVRRLQRDETFNQVQFIDFYRYCDVELDEMWEFLGKRLPWIRPHDTGRSTNCLINEVGIYVHKQNEGYHNYALPYSWDVRLGHKKRDAALEELDDDIDVNNVHRILHEIGYDGALSDSDRTRLVAYYTSHAEIATATLSEHLKDRLPSYMLPGHFVRLDSIPVNTNGKIDLSKLPHPISAKARTSTKYEAPVNETEARLIKIWYDVLRVPTIGTRDNFFDLGGDSILAIQIVARANRMGIRIKPSHVFECLTVQKLAEVWETISTSMPSRKHAEPTPTPIQQWALDHQPKPMDFWNQSIEIQLPIGFTEKDIEKVKHCLVILTNFHDSLRTKITPEDRSCVTLHPITANSLPFVFTDLRNYSSQQVEEEYRLTENTLNKQINFGSDALLGAAVIVWQANDVRLLMMANHMAVDAVSWQQLTADFADCFQALGNGQEPDLELIPTYANWSNQLKSIALHDGFSGELEYWQSAMQATVPIPTINNDAGIQEWQHGEVVRCLEATVPSDVDQKLRKSRVRFHELLLTAFATSLAAWSNITDMRIFVEHHGREPVSEHLDFSRTVGWFTSLTPTHILVPGGDIDTVIASVKDQLRSLPHSGLGYGVLRYLHQSSSVRESLQATNNEVIFNFLGRSIQTENNSFCISRQVQLHRSPSFRRHSVLEVNVVLEDELRIHCTFNANAFNATNVNGLIDNFAEHIHTMLTHLTGSNANTTTVTDFPLAKLNTAQLGNLASILNRHDSKRGAKP